MSQPGPAFGPGFGHFQVDVIPGVPCSLGSGHGGGPLCVSSAASLGLTVYPQIDMLRSRYKSVNFDADLAREILSRTDHRRVLVLDYLVWCSGFRVDG